MKNQWFGKIKWGRICDSLEHVPIPVGEFCFHCAEVIEEEDSGQIMPCEGILRPVHRECLLRMIVGSVGHQRHRCPCFDGNEEDPEGMTKREAAIAATKYYEKFGHIRSYH